MLSGFPQRRQKVTILALWLIASVVLGALAGLHGTSSVWMIGAVAVLLVLFVAISREMLLWACFVATYLLAWMAVSLRVIPAQSSFILEIAVVVLLARGLLVAFERGPLKIPPLFAVVVAVVVSSALLSLASGTPPLVAVAGLRTYLRFPLLGLSIAVAPFGDGFARRLWRALVTVGLLQVAVSAYQLATVGPGDFASGTFGLGGTGIEAVFLGALAATLMIRSVVLGDRINLLDIGLGLMLLVPTLIGSAIIIYALLPACLLFGLLVFTRRASRALIVTAAILFLLLGILTPVALRYSSSTWVKSDVTLLLTSPQALAQYDRVASESGTQLGRADQLRVASEVAFRSDSVSAAFGHGPGSTSRSALGSAYEGPLLSEPGVAFLGAALPLVLVELGIIGVLTCLYVYISAIGKSIRVVREVGSEDLKLVAVFVGLLAFGMLITGIYDNSWWLPGTSLAFWAGLGTLLSVIPNADTPRMRLSTAGSVTPELQMGRFGAPRAEVIGHS